MDFEHSISTTSELSIGDHLQETPSAPTASRIYHRFKDIIRVFTSLPGMATCLILVFMHAFSTQAARLTLLLITGRFSWPLAKAGYLLTVKAVISVVTLAIIGPLARMWTKGNHKTHPFHVGVWTLRIGLLLLAVGNVVIGLSLSIPMLVIGGKGIFFDRLISSSFPTRNVLMHSAQV